MLVLTEGQIRPLLRWDDLIPAMESAFQQQSEDWTAGERRRAAIARAPRLPLRFHLDRPRVAAGGAGAIRAGDARQPRLGWPERLSSSRAGDRRGREPDGR